MFTKIVAFSIALTPFFCWIGWDEGIRTPKETASIICLAVIIVAGFSSFEIKKAFNRYFFAFLGWGVITLFLSNYSIPIPVPNGVVMLPSNTIAFKSLFYIALGLLAVQAIYSSDIDLKVISRTIAITALVMCSYCVLQLFGFDEWFRVADPNTGWIGTSIWEGMTDAGQYSRRLVGTVGNPSILGLFLSLCIPFCLYLRDRLGYLTAVFCSAIILLTLSLTAYITTSMSILFILFFYRRKLAIFLMIILIITGFMAYNTPKIKFMFNPTGRIEMLKESVKVLSKKAITGYGFGSFEYLIGKNPELVKKLNNENWKEAHCEPFQMWFEVGIIGLGIVLLGIVSLFGSFAKNVKTHESIYLMSAMTAFLIMCLTYFPLRIAPLSLYGVVITGLLTRGKK